MTNMTQITLSRMSLSLQPSILIGRDQPIAAAKFCQTCPVGQMLASVGCMVHFVDFLLLLFNCLTCSNL